MCLERKLQASPKLRLAYDDVIKDYLTKNYISPAPPYDPRDPTPIYIIPHHAVLREDKSSTKLRMVLDASMPTSGSQRSLNDLLHVGPNLQGNLFTIILGFRLHAIAMTADCRQQFLQIFVREFDRRFQCFLYRFSPQDPLLLYQFNRVCFGIKSSPYHALRTVRQLVEDDGAKYPLASSIASSSLYMDDIAFSIPTECEAVSASQQLIDLFKGAQWDLVKWNSNSRNVLDNLPASHKLLPSAVEFDKTVQHKLLGLHWSTVDDCFYFKITAPADVMCTKRSILSTIARLWDIMGFVAPTVVYNIPSDNFYHVSGIENPADVLSRGITPLNLVSHPLWFQGPQWARSDPSDWPLRSLDGESIADIPERKLLAHTVCSPIKHCALYDTALRVSSWSRLLRVVVYIYRFLKLLPRRGVMMTAEDLNFSENKLLAALQNKYFAEEYSNILNNKSCSQAFNRLRPFIRNGLILVGGRLSNSALEYAHKHPVILPRNDHIVNMIIDYYHIKYMHAGPELLMSLLRQKYWILSARRIVRQRIHSCNTCFRMKPRPTYPLMADLPECRTRQAVKAFSVTASDYAGPIAYTPVRRRGVHSEKAYLCIFTCLTTRAVHIEVATDLSTPSFLAALKRFLSRRGPVDTMYTDNGTNYKGADSYLRDLYKFLNNEYRSNLEHEFAESRINWKFICPNSPHFGGAWESMVKVIKTHLFRVIGQQILSYEELCTVLTQIECLLNSRPLTVLSSDPAEPSALTPSHFLNTAPLLSLPAPQVKSDHVSLLDRHSLLDKLVQSFWKRWRMEYLHGLQVRQKWNTPSTPITPGTVVVVINDNAPPLTWPLAVVEKVHPSKDDVARVCTVRTAKGTYLRPVVRLCPLPRQ
ncbi:uncharacterized protein LOC123696083 isoform X2 [Colias croceus]|uniref:uncharacterized protein LOC123696083 isoform X2 n=1 Tax=Colias crocea TaxID=72248 RepID=UPI001E27C060|nr:uncharacterized protein LOC123696083 isoform X2 [Colias croceus]